MRWEVAEYDIDHKVTHVLGAFPSRAKAQQAAKAAKAGITFGGAFKGLKVRVVDTWVR